jgi:hypothetical protein
MKYRIKKLTYSNGTCLYKIQKKYLCFLWKNISGKSYGLKHTPTFSTLRTAEDEMNRLCLKISNVYLIKKETLEYKLKSEEQLYFENLK